MEAELPKVHKLQTRAWGVVPMIGVLVGRHVRLVATPDEEEKARDAGKPMPAWFLEEDCEDVDAFRAALGAEINAHNRMGQR